MTDNRKAMQISHVGTVIVPVTDQDQALEFYVGTLGFEKRLDGSYGEGQRWIEVAPPGAATTIALVPKDGSAGIEVSDRRRRGRPCRAAGAGSRGRRGADPHG